MARAFVLTLTFIVACAHVPPRPPLPQTVTISIVGTNDLHGNILPRADGNGGLAMLGGYLANLRRARAADGAVLLVDAGDLFQGTLESNLNEGKVVVEAYNLLGYDAIAIGNHEFDYGPVGPRTNPEPGDDARGALRARAAEARFPFLTSNVLDQSSGNLLGGKNIMPSTIREVAGVRIGIIGVTTAETPFSTAATVFRGLVMVPLADAIDAENRKLRAAGAELIIVVAHAGICTKVKDADEIQQCDDGEIVDAVRALKEPVDAAIAGHTHVGAIAEVAGAPVLEAWKYGRGFGRIDVVYDRQARKKVSVAPPRLQELSAGSYEGAPVVPDARVAAVLEPYAAAAAGRRDERLGVRVVGGVRKAYSAESPLGNLVTDLMLVAHPGDVAITNGGGLRKDLPAGDLTYGAVYEAFPFDNEFATLRMTGAELRALVTRNAKADRGFLSLSGVRVDVSCRGPEAYARVVRADGREVKDDELLTVVTSDFLANGGMEGAMKPDPSRVQFMAGSVVRDGIADVLRKRGGTLDGNDPNIFDPAHPRVAFPRKRPITCPASP